MDKVVVPPAEPILLVTGFEPFNGSPLNPSAMVAERLVAPTGWRLKTLVLPVVSEGLLERVEELVSALGPSLIVSLGEARGSREFRVERTARNRLSFNCPDNAGVRLEDRLIVDNGPLHLHSTLCCQTVQKGLKSCGVASKLSDDAGGFLCNQLLYLLAHRTASEMAKVGFIHLPSLPEQGYGPGLALDLQVRAVQQVLECLCEGEHEKRRPLR